MKIKQNPAQRLLHEWFTYDSATGDFRRKYRLDRPTNWNTRWAGNIAGSKRKMHVMIEIDGKKYMAHRLAWIYVYGDVLTNEIQVDHKNNDSFDNRIENLRLASHSQNTVNRRLNSGKLLPKGVSYQSRSRRYRARLRTHNKSIYLGTFNSAEEAHTAYVVASEKYHGEFARAA